MKKVRKAIAYLIYPSLLIAITYLLAGNAEAFPQQVRQSLLFLPYGLLGVAGLLSLSFNRSKIFFVALVLSLSHLLMVHLAPAGVDPGFYGEAMFKALAVFLPIDILVFSSLMERGIFSPWGKMRFIFIGIQALLVVWILWYQDTDLVELLSMDLFAVKHRFFEGLPQLSIIVFLLTFCILFSRQANKGVSSDSPLLAVLLIVFSAFGAADDPLAFSLHFSAAGLVLLVAVLKASYSMAYIDELTGLPSRRALKEDLLKLKGKYTVSMLDIDHFKKFNDAHGHDVGDEVLKLVASCMKNAGGNGRAYRYGGEEFTILFPGKDGTEAIPFLEELRETIEGRGFIKRGRDRPVEKPENIKPKPKGYKRLSVTVSIGVADRGEKFRKAEEVLKAADKALYRAKSKGRNCVSK